MKTTISRKDLDPVITFLRQDEPILTQSVNVRAFEEEWSNWLGVKHSVFVNSGSSANLVTLAALKERHGAGGEVIVPTITWVSDIAAVLHCGFQPVFVDIDPRTLGMDNKQVLAKLGPETRAIFLTHVLGYNARSTEINAVIGRSQLKRLDENILRRTENLQLFLKHLDSSLYQTDFATEGSSNYAFTLILKDPDPILCRRVMTCLKAHGVEFRRGTAGGGNQLRQPYLRRLFGPD